MALYESLGFSEHPFSKTNADEEHNLTDYFVPPPYFDAIIGDSTSPCASVVLAPRGAGKTALRRMVESHEFNNQFLAVTYDRFEFSSGEKVEKLSLQYHLRNIISRILLSFLSYLSEYPDVIKKLSKEEKKQLSIFVATYLGDLTGDRLQELMKELKSLPEKFKTFWADNVGFMEPVINFVLKKYGLEEIDLPDLKTEEKRLTQTYKYQLETILSLVKQIGFKSIYILVDRVDETELTGNNPEATYSLIKPIIKDLELLGLKGYGFKFFLWDQVEPYYLVDARPDRINQYKLSWNRNSLCKLLSKRIKAFSRGTRSSMHEIVSNPKNINIDEALSIMSNGSPRNLIRLCEHIFAAQSERSNDTSMLDFSSIDQGIISFSEMLFKENFGENYLKEVQKIGRELFTTNYIANDVFKISGQGARNKITKWIQVGFVKQVGTVNIPTSSKPVNFYCIIDPIAVRLIHRTEDFESFIKNRWLVCDHCNTDNLIDIEFYPKNNDAVCSNCGRNLI